MICRSVEKKPMLLFKCVDYKLVTGEYDILSYSLFFIFLSEIGFKIRAKKESNSYFIHFIIRSVVQKSKIQFVYDKIAKFQ